jgi:ppGpp synthetase/RelA/SpoT-type nucleotidyltranferase/HAMP domain-containing protein
MRLSIIVNPRSLTLAPTTGRAETFPRPGLRRFIDAVTRGVPAVNLPSFEVLPMTTRPRSGASAEAGPNRLNTGSNKNAAPPLRGPSLARRLALLTTLIVTGTMAAISGAQLWLDTREEWMQHEMRLRESLAPLVVELGGARTRDEVREALLGFHGAYSDQGYSDHQLTVIDDSGRTHISTATSVDPAPHEVLTGAVPFRAPALGAGLYKLVVTANSTGVLEARNRRWRHWALHVGVTALLTVSLLSFVIRREVIRPIDRLLEGVRKMELGYWDDVPDPGGAWEIRWLGWRFRALGQELSSTVENLVAAQRRAFQASCEESSPENVIAEDTEARTGDVVLHAGAVLARMEGRLARLGCAKTLSAGDRALAQLVWDREAPLAERLGRPDLAAALEDAALRILEPAGFADVCAAIARVRPELDDLAQARQSEIARAAADRGVRLIDIQWRIKHAAGIWRKMQLKGLRLEQIHDLVALRLIVPREADCYRALGVVHDLYSPVVGRFKDYIAAPKPNGYQSIHCSARGPGGSMFEVQIRSAAMHEHAEIGGSSHAQYRDSARLPPNPGTTWGWHRIALVLRACWGGDRRGT